MDYKTIAERILALKKADLELRSALVQNRQLGEDYNPLLMELHNRNAKILNDIIDSYGYPTIDKLGKEASEAAWLVIQHSIGQPEFMKKCKKLLQKAVRENKANPINLAYLTDRIAVLEGKPQTYGTQFDWDENNELNPNPFDNLEKVNQRRKSLGLNTLEEQTIIIRDHSKKDFLSPPADSWKRKQKYDKWRKTVGWIK